MANIHRIGDYNSNNNNNQGGGLSQSLNPQNFCKPSNMFLI